VWVRKLSTRKPRTARGGVFALVCAAMFALPPAALSATAQGSEAVPAATTVASETVLYAFCSDYDAEAGICLDGQEPFAGLVQASDGNLYGTTLSAGANGNGGTVFEITPSGVLTTLYSFCGQTAKNSSGVFTCLDGSEPKFAGLIQASDGNFYGTTSGYSDYGSSANGYGTVFKVTPAGTLTTLHSFCSQPGTTSSGATTCLDGATPEAGLIEADDGNFYGTTSGGGANGYGTVFKITSSGALTILYSFCSQQGTGIFGGLICLDGVSPIAGLIQASDGNFYGTANGGANDEGTVFKITPSGALTTLYSFCSQKGMDSSGDILCLDGAFPNGLIQASDGNFYGTTDGGTSSSAGANKAGTVFKVTPSGVLTTLYSFCSVTDANGDCLDGQYPQAGLIRASDGNLYGTTTGGGANSYLESAAGTVFRIAPAGTLTTLYSFCNQPGLDRYGEGVCLDGDEPEGGLIEGSDGNFYGTTWFGGINDWGTVFKLSVAVATPADATLTVSPRAASFGRPRVWTGVAKTFEVRAKRPPLKSGMSSVFLENFSIKPVNSQNYEIDLAASTCVRGRPLAPGSTCNIVVIYEPLVVTAKGQFDTATLELTTNAEKTMPPSSSGIVDVMLKGKGRPY
jgi:uncharacterized repeat protein (TIGR03803 family)